MATSKCPLCESPCMIKIISTSDSRYAEVDVCRTCGTMYPRDGKAKGSAKPAKKAARKPAKKARKK